MRFLVREVIFLIFKNILRLCKERNITISRLEKDVGLGNATVRGWEESTPKVDNLKLVADYFGVTVDELLKEED